MSHIQLETLPDTPPWRLVRCLISERAEAREVVYATLDAADRGLQLAYDDPALGHVVWLMGIIAFGDRERIQREIGIRSRRDLSSLKIVRGFSKSVRIHLRESEKKSDISELVLLAANECWISFFGKRGDDDSRTHRYYVSRPRRQFLTKEGFADLLANFFSRLMSRFLMFYLARELPLHVGEDDRFENLQQYNEFVESLRQVCRDAGEVVREFTLTRFSEEYQESPPSLSDATKFAKDALKTLRRELKSRGANGVE